MRRPLVQPVDPRHPGRPRIRPLLRLPLLRRRCLAPLFSPGSVPVDRHTRRVHPHPAADSQASGRCSTSASPVRSPASSSSVPVLIIGMTCRRSSQVPEGLRRGRSSSSGEPLLFKAVGVADVRPAARRLHDQHAPDGVRGLVRNAGHGAQPVSDRPARWRPHRRTPSSAATARLLTLRNARLPGGPDVRLDVVDRVDGADGCHAGRPSDRSHPRTARRRRAARSRRECGWPASRW